MPLLSRKCVFVPAALALALSACNHTPPPAASEQPVVTTINGKLATPRGSEAVRVAALAGVNTTTAADGTFKLRLPTEPEMAGRTVTLNDAVKGLGCTGTLNSSVDALRGSAVAALEAGEGGAARTVLAAEGSSTGLLSRKVTVHAWLYSAQAARLSGEVDCAPLLGGAVATVPVKVDTLVKTGWNVVRLELEASANLFGQVSAGGSLVNAEKGEDLTTWRTAEELKAQIGL